MRCVLGTLICVSFTALVHAQAPTDGLLPDWDMRAVLEEMSAHATRLGPVLARIDARSWVAKGGSETFASQLESSKAQAQAIANAAKALAKNPEKLSASL